MNSLYDEFLSAIYAVWNRRWLALAVAWGVCLVGWLVVALIPTSYESKARQIDNPEIAAEAQRINRDYDVLRRQYDELLQDREELRLRGEVRTEREAVKFEVVDPPTTPLAPAAPNRPLLLLGVLIVGIGAGCGTAFAMSKLRSTFSTTSRLERATGLPVLGAISQTVTEASRIIAAKRKRQFYGASAALGGVFILLLAAEFIQRGMVA